MLINVYRRNDEGKELKSELPVSRIRYMELLISGKYNQEVEMRSSGKTAEVSNN